MFDHIISLGEDCFPRLFIDKYHLRKNFPTRMPFDGSIHPFDTMCDLIENDFENYSNNIEYLNHNPSHGFCFKHKKYNLLWNHEKTNDISCLKHQLEKRSNHMLKEICEILEEDYNKYSLDEKLNFNKSILVE